MAKPNYAFEKRQRELAKKRKKEEKNTRKALPGEPGGDAVEGSDAPAAPYPQLPVAVDAPKR